MSVRKKKGQRRPPLFFVLRWFCFRASVFFPRGLGAFFLLYPLRTQATRNIVNSQPGRPLSEAQVIPNADKRGRSWKRKWLDRPFTVHLLRYKIVARAKGDKAEQAFDEGIAEGNNLLGTAVPFWGANHSEIDWFVPETGLRSYHGLTEYHSGRKGKEPNNK